MTHILIQSIKDFFTREPTYRNTVQDFSNPRIAEGVRKAYDRKETFAHVGLGTIDYTYVRTKR